MPIFGFLSEYQKFFDAFDRGKQGYIMATQIGQIMHSMEQDFDEKVSTGPLASSLTLPFDIPVLHSSFRFCRLFVN